MQEIAESRLFLSYDDRGSLKAGEAAVIGLGREASAKSCSLHSDRGISHLHDFLYLYNVLPVPNSFSHRGIFDLFIDEVKKRQKHYPYQKLIFLEVTR